MKIVLTPTVEEVSDLLYDAGLEITDIKEMRYEGTIELWVKGTHVMRLFKLFRGTYKIMEITSWTGATFCVIEQTKKFKWR
ncbi:MAG: hypothetical protein HXS54_06315 [Theionarchaea archaeon]|nr:hypothetical protein [Theionarchaea archaeon]DBA34873.1 TPA_asm: hypothetical protein vir521_00079 [Caudoviricetes sp. vir521]